MRNHKKKDPLSKFEIEPIGILHTCFKEKFGIPRQPGLVQSAHGILKLKDDPFLKTALKGLEGFSHVWVIFVFHEHQAKNWKPSIRPPRLGGAKKVGVLASRSPHRPNALGLSCLKLEKIDPLAPGGPELLLSGVDCLDGTPVVDIKPYLPYTDSIIDAKTGWAYEPIQKTPVTFSDESLLILERLQKMFPHLKALIQEMLELDPRPAFQQRKLPSHEEAAQGTRFGFRLYDFDIKWEIKDQSFHVITLVDFHTQKLLIN